MQGDHVPTSWKEATQVLLPKDGYEIGESGAVPVSKLRPITLQCAVWRLIGSAFTRWALAAMDLQKAFDHCDPEACIGMMRFLGLPEPLCRALSCIWRVQCRWLTWAGASDSSSVWTGSSLPQGDALSPLAMLAMMSAPAKQLQHVHPEVEATFFLDDRNLSARDAGELLEATDLVEDWSRRLGLSENRDKQAYMPRTAIQRSVFVQRRPELLREAVRVLGVDFHSSRSSAERVTARRRAHDALYRARRILWTPLSVKRRRRLFLQLVVPKFCWGWINFDALEPDVRLYKALYRRNCKAHLASSARMRALMEGHYSDARFTAGLYSLGHFWRVFAHGFFSPWDPGISRGTWQGRIRRFLRQLGWQEDAPYVWRHADEGVLQLRPGDTFQQRGRGLHAVRESLRRAQWRDFVAEDRRDSRLLAGVTYDARRIKLAATRFCNAESGHDRSVLRGGACSITYYQVSREGTASHDLPACQFGCDAPASWFHLCWECPRFERTRPAEVPLDDLRLRFGWPLRRRAGCWEALVHMSHVRSCLLSL